MRLVADQLLNPDTVRTPTGDLIMPVFTTWTLKVDKYRVCSLVSDSCKLFDYATNSEDNEKPSPLNNKWN